MTEFKICGLRDVDSALVAADGGAAFLGFVFVPGARRQLTPEQAGEIIDGYRRHRKEEGPRLVGLFAEQPLEEVNRIGRFCGLDMVQLCGEEPPEYWDGVELPVIRQVKVREDGPREDVVARLLEQVEEVVSHALIPLLDRKESGSLGGTGRSFDWRLATQVSKRYEILLAGGLTPENVGRAIATVEPWGVDVSSGVETDGVKDRQKIAAFARAVSRVVD
jgi:phosphoribosylanthranilate isomerase